MISTLEEFQAAHSEIPWLDLLPHTGVWTANVEGAFENLKNANYFGRFETLHTAEEIREAIHYTPGVDSSFCLFLNNTILVFSSTREDHTRHMDQVQRMLWGQFMSHYQQSYVCSAPTSLCAGFTIDQVGEAFRVTDVGAFINVNGRKNSQEEN
ncbi:hypothetical protein CEP54_006854 [Fusarium duplospermum]|uniref:Uncharacterized protein n=1 Tax=Fusarium duplospermum TaxID=1325734 RepID=A0A428Q4M4_9HYPO|nr:hypothetical protein CEP54_006854 [Fusarium duplospermum]